MAFTDASNPFNSSKFWIDQANRFLQPGDFGYVSGAFPWAQGRPNGPVRS